MRRFFAGIKVPTDIGKKLLGVSEYLAPQIPAKRWYGVEQFHITTNFLGELDEEGLAQAIRSLDLVVPSQSSFDLSLKGVGAFPNARVVWCGVGGDTEKLAALQSELRQAFRPLGAEKFAKEKFLPHITIARTGDIGSFRSESVVAGTILDNATWLVDRICLFESVVDPAGAKYPVVHYGMLR